MGAGSSSPSAGVSWRSLTGRLPRGGVLPETVRVWPPRRKARMITVIDGPSALAAFERVYSCF